MKVSNILEIIEMDRVEVKMGDNAAVMVRSHWNREALVVLQIGDGREVAVDGRKLIMAIQNATRWK